MKALYSSYSSKSKQDLEGLLKEHQALTLPAKLTLIDTIREKYNAEGFQKELLDDLSSSIEEELSKIRRLEYLRNLGFSFATQGNDITMKRSKGAKMTDVWGILLSLFLVLVFAISAGLLYSQYINEEIGGLLTFMLIATTILGGSGIILFVKLLNRIINYKGFEIRKDNSKVSIKIRPDFKLEEFVLPLDAKFEIKENEDTITLSINSSTTMVDVIEVKKPGFYQAETLKSLALRLNE